MSLRRIIITILLVDYYCDDATIARHYTRHTWSVIASWGALFTIATSDHCLVEQSSNKAML